jgi:outer membrane protein
MKTKFTLFIAILCIGFSMNAQTKVGTVDSELIVTKMPQLKSVQERLKNYAAKLDSINAIKIKDYDTKVKAFNDASKTMSEEDKKNKYGEIAKMNQEISKFRQNGTQLMQLRRTEYMRPLYKKIADVVEEIAKEKGYSQILTTTGNQFAYIDEKHDITKLVMDKMGIKE